VDVYEQVLSGRLDLGVTTVRFKPDDRISILPRMLLDYINHDNIVAVNLLNPTPSQNICILYCKDKYMEQAAKVDTHNELQPGIRSVWSGCSDDKVF
jgi:hypothetical protein